MSRPVSDYIPLVPYPAGGTAKSAITIRYEKRHAAYEAAKRTRLLVNAPKLDTPIDVRDGFGNGLKVTLYKKGAKVHWPSLPTKPGCRPPPVKRQIQDMSKKSRLAAAFAFSNAPGAWEWMITLTRREQPDNPKRDFDKFTRALRKRFDMNCQWGWVMEYQTRGVVHHHIFLSADFVDRNFNRADIRYRTFTRNGQNTTCVDGFFNSWVIAQWSASTGDTSQAFRAFQEGGIVEVFRLPDAAARYIAKEAGKRCQKQLPEGVEGGHRWWWLSKWGRPIPEGSQRLTHWPLACFVSRVWDKSQLEKYYELLEPVFAKEANFAVDRLEQSVIPGIV